MESSSFSVVERRVATWCGIGAAALGIAGLGGWVSGLPIFTGITPAYKPIAPIVALSLIILGLILWRLMAGPISDGERAFLTVAAGLTSLWGLLEITGAAVGVDLNLENVLTARLLPATEARIATASPVAGGLVFLIGLAMVSIASARHNGMSREGRRGIGAATGGVGILAGIVSLVFALGYAFGAPLLYSGTIISISLTASIGMLSLSAGAVAASGRKNWPLRVVAGNSARARLLRAFVPLTAFVVLAVTIAEHWLSGGIQHVLTASALAVVSALVAGVLALRVAAAIGGAIDRAQQEQHERELAGELLRLANQSRGTRELMQAAVSFFQQQSGCEAVGIRLNREDDYPYYEVRGFPPEFIEAENSLCARDEEGHVLRDNEGNPIQECMCGNVIQGRFDPSKPFFTKGESFWTNSTTELFDKTTGIDRQARTRNRCNGEGYESVALIPVHIGEQRLGILQFNDKRTGVFSPEDIAQWERLAGHLAIVIARAQAEDALRGAKNQLEVRVRERTAELEAERQRFRDTLDTLPAYVVLLTSDYHVPFTNRFFEERFGKSAGRCCYDYLFHRTEPCETCETYTVLKTNAPHHWEWTGPDSRNYDIYDFPFTDSDGSPMIMEVGLDITERKQAEAEVRRHQEHLEDLVAERTADLNRAQVVAHLGSWRLDVRHDDLRWSEETHRMFEVPEGTPMTYETFLASVHPEDRQYVDEHWTAALHGAKYDIEHRIVVGGKVKWVRETAELEFDSDGALLGGFGTVQDITERRQAEQLLLEAERLRAQMAEMVALEINHRMKNNLMLVSGLLELQLSELPAASAAAVALQQAKVRISALSTVHEQMYEQRSEQVELNDVLRRIGEVAVAALTADDIEFSVSGDPVYISARAASTLAVVSNELITNSLKHGAPDVDGTRRVVVSLSYNGGKLGVRVWSSGNPVPENFAIGEQRGLGLRLCQELVNGELRGTFEIRPKDGGTMSEIVIPGANLGVGAEASG